MRYSKRGSRTYGIRKPKIAMQKRLVKAVSIKAYTDWGRDFLKNTDAGKMLATMHLSNVAKTLQKEKPKTQKEMVDVLRKAVKTPQQRFLVFYETSLIRPLTHEEFVEYLELFKGNFPKAYETLYGKKSPKQVAVEGVK